MSSYISSNNPNNRQPELHKSSNIKSNSERINILKVESKRQTMQAEGREHEFIYLNLARDQFSEKCLQNKIDHFYSDIFLKVVSNLPQNQQVQILKDQTVLIKEGQSQYHKIRQRIRIRQELIEQLSSKLAKNQSATQSFNYQKLANCCKSLENIRILSVEIVESIVSWRNNLQKIIKRSRSFLQQTICFQYNGVNIMDIMGKDLNFLKETILSKIIKFSEESDPFLLYPFYELQNTSNSILNNYQCIVNLFHMGSQLSLRVHQADAILKQQIGGKDESLKVAKQPSKKRRSTTEAAQNIKQTTMSLHNSRRSQNKDKFPVAVNSQKSNRLSFRETNKKLQQDPKNQEKLEQNAKSSKYWSNTNTFPRIHMNGIKLKTNNLRQNKSQFLSQQQKSVNGYIILQGRIVQTKKRKSGAQTQEDNIKKKLNEIKVQNPKSQQSNMQAIPPEKIAQDQQPPEVSQKVSPVEQNIEHAKGNEQYPEQIFIKEKRMSASGSSFHNAGAVHPQPPNELKQKIKSKTQAKQSTKSPIPIQQTQEQKNPKSIVALLTQPQKARQSTTKQSIFDVPSHSPPKIYRPRLHYEKPLEQISQVLGNSKFFSKPPEPSRIKLISPQKPIISTEDFDWIQQIYSTKSFTSKVHLVLTPDATEKSPFTLLSHTLKLSEFRPLILSFMQDLPHAQLNIAKQMLLTQNRYFSHTYLHEIKQNDKTVLLIVWYVNKRLNQRKLNLMILKSISKPESLEISKLIKIYLIGIQRIDPCDSICYLEHKTDNNKSMRQILLSIGFKQVAHKLDLANIKPTCLQQIRTTKCANSIINQSIFSFEFTNLLIQYSKFNYIHSNEIEMFSKSNYYDGFMISELVKFNIREKDIQDNTQKRYIQIKDLIKKSPAFKIKTLSFQNIKECNSYLRQVLLDIYPTETNIEDVSLCISRLYDSLPFEYLIQQNSIIFRTDNLYSFYGQSAEYRFAMIKIVRSFGDVFLTFVKCVNKYRNQESIVNLEEVLREFIQQTLNNCKFTKTRTVGIKFFKKHLYGKVANISKEFSVYGNMEIEFNWMDYLQGTKLYDMGEPPIPFVSPMIFSILTMNEESKFKPIVGTFIKNKDFVTQ